MTNSNEPGGMMTHEELIRRFERGTLTEDHFHHQAHVRVGWIYLHRYPLLEALARYSGCLKNLTRNLGKPDLYHETITWAYLILIHERLENSGRGLSWEEFATVNKDLMSWNQSVLSRIYRKEKLNSELARRTFVLPDAG